MRNIMSLVFLCFLLLFLTSGCASHITTATYRNPTWHPNGAIICEKFVYERDSENWSGALHNRSYKYYMTEITINDDNEYVSERDLLEITTRQPEISVSPNGKYILYSGYDGGTEWVPVDQGEVGVLHIVSYPTGEVVNDIVWDEKINSLDWGPDSDRIVFTIEDTKKMYIINKDGTGSYEVTSSAEVVAWRVGETIAFVKYMGTDYSRLATINSNKSSEEITCLIGGDVQKSSTNIYYRGRGDINLESINAVRVANFDGTGDVVKINNYAKETLKLSFENSKLMGGDLTQDGIEGVWVINTDGTKEKQVK